MELTPHEKIEDLMIENYKIIQSDELYRFTSDAVFLSRFVEARKGEVVADFCSGSGIVGLHFYALNHEYVKSVELFEIQKELADMSRKSIELNSLEKVFTVNNIRIQDIPSDKNATFSLITCNPPYKKQQSGFESMNRHIAICRHEIELTLDDICSNASRLLKRSGRICMCHKTERLVDVVLSLNKFGLNPKRIRFISGGDCAPYLFLIEAVKGINPQLKIEKQIINNSKDFSGKCD